MNTAELKRELLRRIKVTMPEHLEEVTRAAEWAEIMHAPQKRDDGTPYANHLYEVALIAQEHHQSAKVIIAALLHDIVEDTPATLEDVKERHGEYVAVIVNGVTKVEKAHFENAEEEKAATYQKLLIAAAEYVESLTVKLCDRLHNVRTFGSTTREKATRKAQETLDIYAPLAYSLSHHYIYRELEDRCFDVLYPEAMQGVRQERELVFEARKDLLTQMGENVQKTLLPYEINIDYKLRRKHFASLVRKTRDGIPAGSLHDIVSLVLVVPRLADCYMALGALHFLYRPLPGQIKDFIALPKGNGYQSIHTVVYHPTLGLPIEVQIRTPQMAHAAEWGKLEAAEDWVNKARPADPLGFLSSLKADLFREEIYVFDHEGTCLILPKESTVADWLRRTKNISASLQGKELTPDTPLESGMILRPLS